MSDALFEAKATLGRPTVSTSTDFVKCVEDNRQRANVRIGLIPARTTLFYPSDSPLTGRGLSNEPSVMECQVGRSVFSARRL